MGSSGVPLVRRVRRRLDDGTLPRECPEKVWSGPALDEQGCSGCGDQILGAQTIYVFSLADLTFAPPGAGLVPDLSSSVSAT